jgi:hypothetical protein
MTDRERAMVAQWLAGRKAVMAEPLPGRSEKGGMRYRYLGLVVNWYHTGTITLQGPGIGTVTFQKLNCKSCQTQPKIIQALNYMVTQADKRAAMPPPANQVDYHRKLDRRLRDMRKARADGRD